MQYKDLIYKITSNKTEVVEPEEMKKDSPDLNAAKKSVQVKDVLIGMMVAPGTVLNKDIINVLKAEVERTLTVLFNSPISDTFSFLPYDKNTLLSMLDLFPEKNQHYIATPEEFEEIKKLKSTKLNLKMVYSSTNVSEDFIKKIDYLVTLNVDTLEPTMKAKLGEKNIMVFPITYKDVANSSQPQKLVSPDPNGWLYNKANGTWSKFWGRDGSQVIPGWEAPADWGLSNNP
jgi:hypothetical protein